MEYTKHQELFAKVVVLDRLYPKEQGSILNLLCSLGVMVGNGYVTNVGAFYSSALPEFKVPGLVADDNAAIVRMIKRTGWRPARTMANGTSIEFDDLVQDPKLMVDWCLEVLGTKALPLERFPAVPDTWHMFPEQKKDGAHYPCKEMYRLRPSYIRGLYDERMAGTPDRLRVVDSKYQSRLFELSEDKVREKSQSNRKASSEDIREYIDLLLKAARQHPVLTSMMASGKELTDPDVQVFLWRPENLGQKLVDYTGSRYQATWLDSMAIDIASEEDHNQGEGHTSILTKVTAMVQGINSALKHYNGGYDLELTKHTLGKVHDLLTDPATGLAAEFMLLPPILNSRGEPYYHLYTEVAKKALLMHNHPEAAAIRKNILNRVKSTGRRTTEDETK